MKKYIKEAKALVDRFAQFEINVIPREENVEADALSRYVWKPIPLNVHFLESVAVQGTYECFNIQNTDKWATPIRAYLETRIEPLEEAEAKRMKPIPQSYTLIDGVLYKKGFSTPFL